MASKDISDRVACEAIRDWRETSPLMGADELLASRTGQPLKVCQRVIERVMNRGLADSGVSDRTGWLTQKGKELLCNVVDL